MTIKKALEIVTGMGYDAKQSGLDYVVGVRDGKHQWFKVLNGKLYKRVDVHPSFVKWEVVE